jgi:hypothetical protein
MDTLFVHEKPDQDAKRNKRPRVVTACDDWSAHVAPLIITITY